MMLKNFYINLPPKMPWTLLESNFYKYQKSFNNQAESNRFTCFLFMFYCTFSLVMLSHCLHAQSIDTNEQLVFRAKSDSDSDSDIDYSQQNVYDPFLDMSVQEIDTQTGKD